MGQQTNPLRAMAESAVELMAEKAGVDFATMAQTIAQGGNEQRYYLELLRKGTAHALRAGGAA